MGSSGNPLQQQNDTVRLSPYTTETDRAYNNDYLGQALVNCFAHVVRNPTTGDGEVQVSKRNGFAPLALDIATHVATFDNGDYDNIYAVYAVTNLYDVYVVAVKNSDTDIKIIQVRPESGTSTLIGSITASGAGAHKVYFSHGWCGSVIAPVWTLTVNFVDSDGVTNKAYTANASSGVFTASSLAQITATTSPWGASVKTRGPILQLNNQWYVAALDGRIYSTGNTLPNSSYVSQADIVTVGTNLQSWCASGSERFIASRFPEQFEGMILYKHHLVAFGKTSIQFYNDEGQSLNAGGTPILPTDQALIRFGVMSNNHMINVDDVLYWISYGKNDTVGVWRLDGYTPVKISNKTIDDKIVDLFNAGFANYCYLYTFLMGSKKHVAIGGISRSTMSTTLNQTGWPATLNTAFNSQYGSPNSAVYCVDDKTWWHLSMDNLNIIGISPFTLFNRTNTKAYRQYFMRSDSTRVWYVSSTYADTELDNVTVAPITTTIQFNTIDFSNEKRKRVNKVKAIFQGSPDTLAAGTSYLVLAYNRENNIPSTTFPNRFIDYYQPTFRYYWNNLGMARQLNLALIDISDQPMELRYLELDLAQGVA